MRSRRFTVFVGALMSSTVLFAAEPKLPGVGAAMETMIAAQEISGAVTVVMGKDQLLHVEATGYRDLATHAPMTIDTMFRIASMTKPITGVAVLLLQDEGRLKLTDPVAKYLPEFASLKTPSGKPANLTILQLLTHTSGLGEASGDAARRAKTLADLVPVWVAAPMQYAPGEKWKYTQSGINATGRIIEVVSGMSFDEFLRRRLFDPLGMRDTTFYLSDAQRMRLATAYSKNRDTGKLEAVPPRAEFGAPGHPPEGAGGLFSTAHDYAQFCRMLLNRGVFDGRRILSEAAFAELTTVHTRDLPTGFFQRPALGGFGANYGWGVAVAILREPHAGVGAMLAPGTFGHGGAWGTQAWIDPVNGVAYLLMIQRTNFESGDGNEVRRVFQQAAYDGLRRSMTVRPAASTQ